MYLDGTRWRGPGTLAERLEGRLGELALERQPTHLAVGDHGEPGILRYLERTCPDYLVIFPAWFPMLSAMTDRFRPIYRITLAHNTVAGADEMVVYKTAWTSASCR